MGMYVWSDQRGGTPSPMEGKVFLTKIFVALPCLTAELKSKWESHIHCPPERLIDLQITLWLCVFAQFKGGEPFCEWIDE